MEHLEGRTAVITGAASGIGLATAEALVAEGMQVVLADIDGDRAADEATRLGDPSSVVATRLDVRDAASVEAVAALAVERFGGLHVAMNNAGIVNGGPAWEIPLEDWHALLAVNLWGVIHGIHSFVPRILATGEEGHVVNTASMAAVMPVRGIAPYTTAKHGVLGLSDVLRLDLEAAGAPVGVSAVIPGMIRTGMNPIGTVEPTAVARNIVDAIRTGRRYVYTDDHSRAQVEERLDALRSARDDVIA